MTEIIPNIATWIIGIVCIGLLVLIHELGHFVTAKFFGVKVQEFGFGFPPKIFGLRYKGTLYSINLIPFGGFVKLLGEEDPSDPASLAAQKNWKKIVILCAGSLVNLLTPIIIFFIIFLFPAETIKENIQVIGVAPGSPAESAGIQKGDTIISIDNRQIDNQFDLINVIYVNLGSDTKLSIRKGSTIAGISSSPDTFTTKSVSLTPRYNPPKLDVVSKVFDPETQVDISQAQNYDPSIKLGDQMKQGAIGVRIASNNQRVITHKNNPLQAIKLSFQRVLDVIIITKNGLTQWASGGENPGLSGPVGIVQLSSEVVQQGLKPLLNLVAIISISLAIFNLLPIPALDGGRIAFILLEIVRSGKKIPHEKESLINAVSFVVLLSGIIIISYFDIIRIFNGTDVIK